MGTPKSAGNGLPSDVSTAHALESPFRRQLSVWLESMFGVLDPELHLSLAQRRVVRARAAMDTIAWIACEVLGMEEVWRDADRLNDLLLEVWQQLEDRAAAAAIARIRAREEGRRLTALEALEDVLR